MLHLLQRPDGSGCVVVPLSTEKVQEIFSGAWLPAISTDLKHWPPVPFIYQFAQGEGWEAESLNRFPLWGVTAPSTICRSPFGGDTAFFYTTGTNLLECRNMSTCHSCMLSREALMQIIFWWGGNSYQLHATQSFWHAAVLAKIFLCFRGNKHLQMECPRAIWPWENRSQLYHLGLLFNSKFCKGNQEGCYYYYGWLFQIEYPILQDVSTRSTSWRRGLLSWMLCHLC